MSLYNKYRPLDFGSLLGQDHVCEVLQGALKKDRVSHAYLFTGPRGTGKTSAARILARAINCLNLKDVGPCNECEICIGALEERLTDLVEIDAASHGLVDDARALVEQAKFMPVQARKKIYIIDEVHMLSKSAFNALLKIIEEPPDHVHFILATTEAHKVLETIKSRCQRFDFHLAEDELLIEHLNDVCHFEKVKPPRDSLVLLAEHARGSFRDSLSLLEQVIGIGNFKPQDVSDILGLSDKASIHKFIDLLMQGEKDEALSLISDIHAQGLDLYQFCQAVLEELRDELLKEPTNRKTLMSWIDIFFDALDQLRDPVIPELPMELAVLKCENLNIVPKGEGGTISKKLHPADAEIQKGDDRAINEKLHPADAESSEGTTMSANDLKKKPAQRGNFDATKFLEGIKHSSLRTLIKYSKLEITKSDLKISARSDFELNKIKDSKNMFHLLDVIKSTFGENMILSLDVSEPEKPSGLSTEDLESIF